MASNEKQIREDFKDLVSDFDSNILIVDEFCGGSMRTRADLALITKKSIIMVEIKSDKDTLDRLVDQIRDYNLYSGKVIVILDIIHKEKQQFISFIKGRTKCERDIAIKNIYTYQELVDLSHATLYNRVFKNKDKEKNFSINNGVEYGNVPEIKFKQYKQELFNELIKEIK